MKIIGFCQGGPFDPHSWSGSNRGIFTALQRRGMLAGAYDVELSGVKRYWAALREYSPDKTVWRHNFLKSPYPFKLRTREATRLLREHGRAADAALQVGAMFDATASRPDLARYCYLDSNSRLSENGGRQSFGYYARSEYKRMAFERERGIYQRSAGVFVFSDFVKNSLVNDFGIAPTRVHTVYAGVNLKVPATLPEGGIKEPIILFIGRDFERKGGPLLIEAFRHVRTVMPRAKLIIAGASPSVDLPGVEVVGFIDKHSADGERRLADLFSRAAVFTMPSHFEPFGIVYAEAMHFGLPCVAVNRCAMPEIVTHGQTGLLVQPDHARALANALLEVLQNPTRARAMGMAGRQKAKEWFTWDKVAERMAHTMQQAEGNSWTRVAV